MQKKYTPKDYDVVPSVYGNYYQFQDNLSSFIQTYTNTKSIINILEIGCGTGITTQVILKSRPDINLISIDNDSRMIKSCNLIKNAFNNLDTFESDALDFIRFAENDYFNIIVSGFTIHNFHKNYRKSLYQELYRVMSFNSVFLNADKFVSDDFNKQIEGLKFRLGSYIDYLLREQQYDLLKKWVEHYLEDTKPEFIMKFNEELDIIKGCGFSDESSYVFKSELEMLGLLKAIKK